MAKGLSIHIGVNKVNRRHYDGEWQLPWCVNDAIAMRDIAASKGYDWLLLLNEKATTTALLNALDIAADFLRKGDILFLSFSGHGDLVIDTNNDEEKIEGQTAYDQAWALYDRRLIDDTINEALKKFRAGTRIIVVADCCHAGTSIKPIYRVDETKYDDYEDGNPNSIWGEKWSRLMRQEKQEIISSDNPVSASVLLLAACDDREVVPAGSSSEHSLFTHILLEVWRNGEFNGSYNTFYKKIVELMPGFYHPQYFPNGKQTEVFGRQRPFSIYK